MKKILILMSFMLPIAMMAQTRPAPKKSQERPVSSKENFTMERPTPFSLYVCRYNRRKIKKDQAFYRSLLSLLMTNILIKLKKL